jgi:hypothetical protein
MCSVSPPRDNVPFVPNENVPLTGSAWGGERTRSFDDDPAGQRSAGGTEESLQETDQTVTSGPGISCRQVKRLMRALRDRGDEAVVHALRGRPSPRKTSAAKREKILRILSQEKYHDFGPTLASEYLAKKHEVQIGREALRQIMIAGGLWRARRQKVEEVHQWRPRRSCRGELVQWDTSEHDWLEGRGEKLYLIHMIDDATSELTARFVPRDSVEENIRLLWSYLERHGRPGDLPSSSLILLCYKITISVEELFRGRTDRAKPTGEALCGIY